MLDMDQCERVQLLSEIRNTYQELQEREVGLLAVGLLYIETGDWDKVDSINNEVAYIRTVLTDIKSYLESNYKQAVSLH